ncbi:hypothetical protein CHEID_08300 [Corynebacterium heidelbergense]|nr:hypothetical protein [Corynebacterium heidelbergense]WCZ37190.1 hypothetical protein CHEID_08300 [Corynebacterium heidelbergense]
MSQDHSARDTDRETATAASAALHPTTAKHTRTGSRLVAGFAAGGLLLAGLVGGWTWQSASSPIHTRPSSISESAAPGVQAEGPTGSAPATAVPQDPRGEDSDPGTGAPARHEAQVPQDSRNVQLSERDPYLPPNSWNGNGGPVRPTATVVVEPSAPVARPQASPVNTVEPETSSPAPEETTPSPTRPPATTAPPATSAPGSAGEDTRPTKEPVATEPSALVDTRPTQTPQDVEPSQ